MACITTTVVAAAVAVTRVVTAPSAVPATAHVPGLLSWPPRGELIGNRAVRDQAIKAWRAVAPAPAGQPYFLYAGQVDRTRLVVLQGYFEDTPAVAVVLNGRLSRLVPLPTANLQVLAVSYDVGGGVFVTRLLAAPDVATVAVRSSRSVPQVRPPFVVQRLTDGLSAPWVTPGPSQPWSAVRIVDRDGGSTVRVISGQAVIPATVRPVFLPPPVRWVGLRVSLTPADDGIWFAQICNSLRPRIEPVWTGRVPGFPAPIRVERVRCAGQTVARFLTGSGRTAVTLREVPDMAPRLDVYAAVVSPPGTFGPTYVVLVGSRRVARIQVAGKLRRTRVAVVRLEQSRDLRVYAANGARIAVR